MIITCEKCRATFEDCYRSTLCPHGAFPANDGNNNFAVHHDAFLSPPSITVKRIISDSDRKDLERMSKDNTQRGGVLLARVLFAILQELETVKP